MFNVCIFDREIAGKLECPNKAIILAIIETNIEAKEAAFAKGEQAYVHCHHEDDWYSWQSHSEWQAQLPWLSIRSIKRYFEDLKEAGLVKTAYLGPKKSKKTLYYTIDREKLAELRKCQIVTISKKVPNCHNQLGQIDTFPPVSSSITQAHNTQAPDRSLSVPKIPKFLEQDLPLAERWLKHSRTAMKWARTPMSWTPEYFAQGIGKLRKALNLNSEGLEAIVVFIERDDFWGRIALSPASLMKRSNNGNLKAENLLLAMEPKSNRDNRRVDHALEEFMNS